MEQFVEKHRILRHLHNLLMPEKYEEYNKAIDAAMKVIDEDYQTLTICAGIRNNREVVCGGISNDLRKMLEDNGYHLAYRDEDGDEWFIQN